MAASNDLGVGGFSFLQACEMALWNDEHVGGRLGIDVLKGEDVIVLVNFFCGYFAANDAAEKAVWIGHASPHDFRSTS